MVEYTYEEGLELLETQYSQSQVKIAELNEVVAPALMIRPPNAVAPAVYVVPSVGFVGAAEVSVMDNRLSTPAAKGIAKGSSASATDCP